LVALKKELHAGAFAIEGGRAIGAVHRAVEGSRREGFILQPFLPYKSSRLDCWGLFFFLCALCVSARGYLFVFSRQDAKNAKGRKMLEKIQRKRHQRRKKTQTEGIFRLNCRAGTVADLPAVPSQQKPGKTGKKADFGPFWPKKWPKMPFLAYFLVFWRDFGGFLGNRCR